MGFSYDDSAVKDHDEKGVREDMYYFIQVRPPYPLYPIPAHWLLLHYSPLLLRWPYPPHPIPYTCPLAPVTL